MSNEIEVGVAAASGSCGRLPAPGRRPGRLRRRRIHLPGGETFVACVPQLEQGTEPVDWNGCSVRRGAVTRTPSREDRGDAERDHELHHAHNQGRSGNEGDDRRPP
jgi:hypothetical protein